ncbi:glutaredoxin family protein [Ramlibacter sp. AN1015]|uniref:glutaredoxin family protein n=1 Tax=Ramlibacter sp. AN1015 TaxID=3133428 RepID=UPI0030BE1C6C
MTRTAVSAALLALAASALSATAQAQPIYRSVGPDGRVVFSDVPPPDAKASAPTGGVAPSPTAPLPFALRQVAQRFPVVLYAGPECPPCDSARTLLVARGIPYAERSITTAEDGNALQRVSGERSLPFLTIGQQHVKGFAASEWHKLLDAAGYPQVSALPAGWRAAPASPLAPPTAAAVPAPAPAQAEQPSPRAAATSPGGGSRATGDSNTSNPAGIQF